MSGISTSLSTIIFLASMAFFTLLERKILGYTQLRKGPNKMSMSGVLQPAGDGIKLFSKETTKLMNSNTNIFIGSPILALILACLFWSLSPNISQLHWTHFPITMFFCISTFAIYPMMMAGWASNSKYSLIGALRSVAQTISYEVSMALILIASLMILKSFKLATLSSFSKHLNLWLIAPPLMMIWFSTTLAETNRSPYDLAEGESELVSGFNTEYSGPEFALIFMSEYLNILFMAMMTALLFFPSLGLWPIMLSLKTTIFAACFIFARTSFPRLRYDRLMNMTWSSYLPLSLSFMLMLLGT